MSLPAKSEIRLAVLCYFQGEPLRSQAQKPPISFEGQDTADELLSLNYHPRLQCRALDWFSAGIGAEPDLVES